LRKPTGLLLWKRRLSQEVYGALMEMGNPGIGFNLDYDLIFWSWTGRKISRGIQVEKARREKRNSKSPGLGPIPPPSLLSVWDFSNFSMLFYAS
jgi:hypothetical protein